MASSPQMGGRVKLNLSQKLAMKGQDAPAQLRDPNNLNDLLAVVGKTLERTIIR